MLGYIHHADRGTTNALLADIAARQTAMGRIVTGIVQSRAPGDGAHPCDMELACLPNGPRFGIAQDLGRGSRGCRMDLNALETAAEAVSAQIARGADLLIINKFGAQESQGRGFAPVIAQALELGIPVLTVVNPINLHPFLEFAGELAVELAPDATGILTWIAGQTQTPAPQM